MKRAVCGCGRGADGGFSHRLVSTSRRAALTPTLRRVETPGSSNFAPNFPRVLLTLCARETRSSGRPAPSPHVGALFRIVSNNNQVSRRAFSPSRRRGNVRRYRRRFTCGASVVTLLTAPPEKSTGGEEQQDGHGSTRREEEEEKPRGD